MAQRIADNLVGALLLGISLQTASAESQLGLVAQPPADERCVAVDGAYMVAYTETIPGTNITFTMVPVPGGEYVFQQGDRSLRVRIEPYWMGQTEVTWAEYREYMRLTDVFDRFNDQGLRQVTSENAIDAITAPSKLYEPSFTFETGDKPNQPAISMTQYAAKQYTKWLSLLTQRFYRLPSETEWEYACRAGSTGVYCFGDDEDELEEYAWYDDMNDYQTGAVATKKPNAWGLYDMHGNAAEWVLDGAETSVATADGNLVNVEAAIAWPAEVSRRIVKGGSWDSAADECTSTSRIESQEEDWKANDPTTPKSPWWYASYDGQLVGFRVIRRLANLTREQQERYWQADHPSIVQDTDRRIDNEGRGKRGLVDPQLSNAIEDLRQP